MEDLLVVAATAGGTIELFRRQPGGLTLTLLGRWERRGQPASWELASTLVGMLQAMVESVNAEGWVEHCTVPHATRLINVGLGAVGFDRTYAWSP